MITVIFFRKEGAYHLPLCHPDKCGKTLEVQAAHHAELNPGTLRIETIGGVVLWQIH